MQIVMQSRCTPITPKIEEYIRRRLRFALGRVSDRVQRIIVRLSDINGPRGGADKNCLLRVQLIGYPEIVIQDTQSQVVMAIDRAANRAKRTVLRKVEQRQQRESRAFNLPKHELLDQHVSLSAEDYDLGIRRTSF